VLPPGAYWEGNTLVLPNDPTAESSDVDNSQDEFATNADAANVPEMELFNVTASALEKRLEPPGKFAVDVRMGGPKQHIGTLRKNRLWRAIYDCLGLVGEQGRGTWFPLVPPGQTDKNNPWQCPNLNCARECKIPNIVYNSGDDTYATNAHLTVRVEWSELKEGDHKGIRMVAVSRSMKHECVAD